MKSHERVGVIGAGRFGRAFIQGLLGSNQIPPTNIWASARSEATLSMVQKWGIEAHSDFSSRVVGTDILLLSVKPAQIVEVLNELNKSSLSEKTLIISVAAGTSIAKIEANLKKNCPIIRAMPNSPCTIRAGVTAYCRGTRASDKDLANAERIFDFMGKSIEVREDQMDLVTALSGSGPAYFYFVMEAMIIAGVEAGLSQSQAKTLVIHTARGAAEMALTLGRSPKDLKGDVATPGGCTIEALKILETEGIAEVFKKAIQVAEKKSASLGSN